MKTIFKYLTVCLCSLTTHGAFSQLVLSGATCIVPNTTYQYVVSGIDDSLSGTQICINKGLILDSSDSLKCQNFSGSVNQVLVIWSDSSSNVGSLNATSSSQEVSLTVHFADELFPGSIDSASKNQMISVNTIPAKITCSADSGGSCSPSYSYQWQSSLNVVSWEDIPDATDTSLTIDSPLTQTTFYRRMVTEVNSGSIGYSDVASVLVIMSQTDSTAFTTNATANTNDIALSFLSTKNVKGSPDHADADNQGKSDLSLNEQHSINKIETNWR